MFIGGLLSCNGIRLTAWRSEATAGTPASAAAGGTHHERQESADHGGDGLTVNTEAHLGAVLGGLERVGKTAEGVGHGGEVWAGLLHCIGLLLELGRALGCSVDDLLGRVFVGGV